MKLNLLDLIFLLIAFSASWYFKSDVPVEFQGALVIVSTSLVAIIIIIKRKLSLGEIGFKKITISTGLFREVLKVSLLIFFGSGIRTFDYRFFLRTTRRRFGN